MYDNKIVTIKVLLELKGGEPNRLAYFGIIFPESSSESMAV